MRLVTYEHAGCTRIGAVVGDRVADLRQVVFRYLNSSNEPQAAELARLRVPNDMVDFISAGPRAWDTVRHALATIAPKEAPADLSVPVGQVQLKAPLVPQTMICGGANFHDHLDETNRSKPTEVEFFLKSPYAVIGPGETVAPSTKVSRKYDYEVELGIIIGTACRNVSPEQAHEYIFGYTIFNDISARDRQVIPYDTKDGKRRFQLRFGEGKSYDTGCPIGPWIVTPDDLPDTSSLQLRTTINDELRQNNTTRNLIWGVPALVSFYSRYMTLQPGFILASGTPGGPALGSDVELGADPYERKDGVRRGGYLQPGDVIRCEIEGIGVLENPFGADV